MNAIKKLKSLFRQNSDENTKTKRLNQNIDALIQELAEKFQNIDANLNLKINKIQQIYEADSVRITNQILSQAHFERKINKNRSEMLKKLDAHRDIKLNELIYSEPRLNCTSSLTFLPGHIEINESILSRTKFEPLFGLSKLAEYLAFLTVNEKSFKLPVFNKKITIKEVFLAPAERILLWCAANGNYFILIINKNGQILKFKEFGHFSLIIRANKSHMVSFDETESTIQVYNFNLELSETIRAAEKKLGYNSMQLNDFEIGLLSNEKTLFTCVNYKTRLDKKFDLELNIVRSAIYTPKRVEYKVILALEGFSSELLVVSKFGSRGLMVFDRASGLCFFEFGRADWFVFSGAEICFFDFGQREIRVFRFGGSKVSVVRVEKNFSFFFTMNNKLVRPMIGDGKIIKFSQY
jgi:hypothetical protein